MRLFGDHIVELRDGGAPLDKRNLTLRCGQSS
jgi:5-methylcytosine-specific restriction protein A